jgi:hypothetical protein
VALENNPRSAEKRSDVINLVSKKNPCIEMDFWEKWLEH